MSRSKFSLLLSFQLILSMALAWTSLIQHWWIFSLLILLAWLLNARGLLQVQRRVEEDLQSTLQNSVAEDFNFYWPIKEGHGSKAKLYQLLNLWSVQLRDLKQKREDKSFLLQQVLNKLPSTILLIDTHQHLRVLNSGNPPLQGARNDLGPSDWPEIFPFIQSFLKEDLHEKTLNLKQDGHLQIWKIEKMQVHSNGQEQHLIILTNRQLEHERQEDEALEKILHVLTHEIMNSVSPINSLSDTMRHQLAFPESQREEGYKISKEQFEDLQSTANIIQRRSKGLMSFVERYARFARLPKIQKQEILWKDFLSDFQKLNQPEIAASSVKFTLQILKSSRPLYADHDLLQQVFLNLTRNALESLTGHSDGLIRLELDQGDGYHYLRFIDNGPKVEDDLINQIFLPFFSTKKRGSGIGLSLSRKIIMAHGGRLYLQQKKDLKAFCIDLPY